MAPSSNVIHSIKVFNRHIIMFSQMQCFTNWFHENMINDNTGTMPTLGTAFLKKPFPKLKKKKNRL